MNRTPLVRELLLEIDGQGLSLFHLRAVAAFRQQWLADPPREVVAADDGVRRRRERQLDALFARLVNDVSADSIDELHEAALQLLRVVKG